MLVLDALPVEVPRISGGWWIPEEGRLEADAIGGDATEDETLSLSFL